jgi:hypothetical protein
MSDRSQPQNDLDKIPAGVPPPGVVVRLDQGDPTPGYVILGLCLLLTTLAVAVRLYSRLCVVKRVKVEDYLGLAAFVRFPRGLAVNDEGSMSLTSNRACTADG